jgi:hypothetical protein
MAVLIVDDDRSFCGECGRGAFPKDQKHVRVAGMAPIAERGCGVEWTEIATHLMFVPYSAEHEPAAEYVRALRPDLTYIGVIPWDWDRSRMDA